MFSENLASIRDTLKWQFGKGGYIQIGQQALGDTHNGPYLSEILITHLYQRGIFLIGQILYWQKEIPIWLSAYQLGLPAPVEDEWEGYCNFLRSLGLHKHRQGDKIRWGGKTLRDQIIIKDLYISMMKEH